MLKIGQTTLYDINLAKGFGTFSSSKSYDFLEYKVGLTEDYDGFSCF